MSYKDKTYCASPHCKNECGRKMPDQNREEMWRNPSEHMGTLVSYAYFCGTLEDEKLEK